MLQFVCFLTCSLYLVCFDTFSYFYLLFLHIVWCSLHLLMIYVFHHFLILFTHFHFFFNIFTFCLWILFVYRYVCVFIDFLSFCHLLKTSAFGKQGEGKRSGGRANEAGGRPTKRGEGQRSGGRILAIHFFIFFDEFVIWSFFCCMFLVFFVDFCWFLIFLLILLIFIDFIDYFWFFWFLFDLDVFWDLCINFIIFLVLVTFRTLFFILYYFFWNFMIWTYL